MPTLKLPIALAACVTLTVLSSQAQAVHKCTGRDGKVVYQDAPCDTATGPGQQIKTWDNTPGAYGPSRRTVTPNDKLAAPPQAASLMALYRRWIDAEKLGNSTARVSLAGPAATLQSLLREAEGLQVPQCLGLAKPALVALIKENVDTLIDFMQKQELTGMVYQLVNRSTLIAAFEQNVTAAKCPV